MKDKSKVLWNYKESISNNYCNTKQCMALPYYWGNYASFFVSSCEK